MTRVFTVVALVLCAMPAFGAKSCEELKSEIAAKLDAKGVKGYELSIVATDSIAEQKVVGSCDGGTKKITYHRGS